MIRLTASNIQEFIGNVALAQLVVVQGQILN
jgi:hypothetical protein